MFAVAGASGRIGSMTVEGLIKRGQKVRALVRSAEKGEALAHKRAELVVLDLLDTEALTKALTGTTGAFLFLPTPPPEQDFFTANEKMVTSLVTAVKRSKVPTVVFLSSIGAQHPAGTGPIVALHHAEKALTGAAKSVTFLRAASPLELWAPVLLDAIDSGKLPFFGNPHAAFPQVGAKDVGDAAAHALEEHVPGTRFIEVAGVQNWSAEDVAVIMTSLLKQQIHAVERPADEEVAYQEHLGLVHARAGLMAERSKANGRGLLHFSHPYEVRRGTTPLFDALGPLVA
jgi:uncharacterized protein YbjT (DUF2867 family)